MRKIISVLLCVLLLVVLVLCGCGQKQAKDDASAQASAVDASMRRTVLYLQDDYGMLVPVLKSIPWVEGIGKEALDNLTNTAENQASASALGLKAVLPADVKISLSIKDGEAKVHLDNLAKFESAQQEFNAVSAVVNTLMEFPSVSSVQVIVNGKSGKLPHGTDISKPFTGLDLNVESMSLTGDSLTNKLVLYFPNYEGTVNIPITRYVSEEPSMQSAIEELLKGPAEDSMLRACFPTGTELRSLNLKDGVATIDFTKDFENIIENIGMERRAMETLYLTCGAFGDVKQIKIKVNGKAYKLEEEAAAAPAFANVLQQSKDAVQ